MTWRTSTDRRLSVLWTLVVGAAVLVLVSCTLVPAASPNPLSSVEPASQSVSPPILPTPAGTVKPTATPSTSATPTITPTTTPYVGSEADVLSRVTQQMFAETGCIEERTVDSDIERVRQRILAASRAQGVSEGRVEIPPGGLGHAAFFGSSNAAVVALGGESVAAQSKDGTIWYLSDRAPEMLQEVADPSEYSSMAIELVPLDVAGRTVWWRSGAFVASVTCPVE